MTSRDWFMLGARLLGLYLLYQVSSDIGSWLNIQLGYVSPPDTFSAGGYLVHGFLYLAFALYLLMGTRHLTSLCYGDESESKPDSSVERQEKPAEPTPPGPQ